MILTPTLTNASATWTLTKEHERMIKSAQRKMLRLIVQTKRKYKQKKTQKETSKDKGPKTDEESSDCKKKHREHGEEIEEGETYNSDCDQDSDVSFIKDSEEDMEEIENEEEEWIDYLMRSTKETEERMKSAEVPLWIEAHRKMKWR